MSGEFFKGGIHYLTGSLGLTLALYSGLRLTDATDHRLHLVVNIVAYLALWAFEAYQVRVHWSR